MGTRSNIKIANDNAPSAKRNQRGAYVSGHYALKSKPRSSNPEQAIPQPIESKKDNIKIETTHSLGLTAGLWIGAIIMIIATFALDLGTIPKVFTSITLLWAGLWSSYVLADHGHWRLSEISVVTALVGLMGAIITSSDYFGLGLTLADDLMLMSILPLLAGYVLKSRICVLASICASLIWSALSFSGLVETSNLMMLFPLIFAAQVFLGTKIRSGMAISLAILTAYYWGLNFILTGWSADDLPLTFAMAGLFIIGVAHHRSGKAAEDKQYTGSSIHIYAGWIAAMIGAMGFQYFWLSPEAVQGSTATLSLTGLNIWKTAIILAMSAIFCSAIIRYKYAQISRIGIALLTATSAIIPMMLWFPTWPQKIINIIPGTAAVPTIGVLIGAAITAAALGMTLNGVRRHSPLMMGMGITVLLTESYLVMRPNLMTIDNGVIFCAGFLASLAVGVIIAGSSLAHQAPSPRLKHS